jgi:tight adherence protein B
MSAILFFCFLVILALLLLSISFGLRFYETRSRNKLVSMLRTVTENGGEEQHVNILLDPDAKKDNVEDLFGSLNVTGNLTKLLSESGLDWTLSRFSLMTGGLFVAGLIGGLAMPGSIPAGIRMLLAASLGAALPLLYVKRKRSARIAELESQLPDALDFLARSMRAGHAFTISLEMVGEEVHDPLGQEFRALFNEQNLGASLERSLENFNTRVPLPDVRFFSSAVLLQRQTGGNLSEILNRLSHIIRERFQLKGKVQAASAHGRMTATILTILPLATLGGLMLTSPGYLDPMFKDTLGRKILAMGVLAQIMGNFFIRKIIRIKV